MLFGYPIEATANNWLHDCLCEMLRSIHARLQASQTPPDWPEIIPLRFRASLRTRTGLKERLAQYQNGARQLSIEQQGCVLQALDDQNRIALLLSAQCSCESIEELPNAIREPAKDLFWFAYDLLKDLGVRSGQYSAIYSKVPCQVCPFCGCEYFDAPGAPNEDLDHVLAKSKYPFAASNLRNLVPMGHKCNSHYKGAQDILYSDNGKRRKSFDPYDHRGIRVSLMNSQPFAGEDGKVPSWQIEFTPITEEIITWDNVFRIRERYKRDILDPWFGRWLEEFRAWCRSQPPVVRSDAELIAALDSYVCYHEQMGFGDRSFLKAAVFQMLHKHCVEGNTRLLSFIRYFVEEDSQVRQSRG